MYCTPREEGVKPKVASIEINVVDFEYPLIDVSVAKPRSASPRNEKPCCFTLSPVTLLAASYGLVGITASGLKRSTVLHLRGMPGVAEASSSCETRSEERRGGKAGGRTC